MNRDFSNRTTAFRRSSVLLFAMLLLASLCAARVSADPIDVSYTVSGSSGAWMLNFSVTNDLDAGQVVYLFGVVLPAQDPVASPAGWANCANGCTVTTFNPGSVGGPNVTFNNLWHEALGSDPSGAIGFGDTESGFEAEVNSILPPTSVEWFAYGADITPNGTSPYTGGGEFILTGDCLDTYGVTCTVQEEENPGFSGNATVPEPSSLLLLAASVFAILAFRRFASVRDAGL